MNPSQFSSLIQLRSAVAALGESHQRWRSIFLSPTGLSFLQRIYPRTYVAAAIRLTAQVARKEHDARIGRGQVAHLFRLPPPWERAIDDALREWDTAAQAEQRERLVLTDGPLAILRGLAAGSWPAALDGPLNCGDLSQLDGSRAIGQLAGQYLRAFEEGHKVYPFFEVRSQR